MRTPVVGLERVRELRNVVHRLIILGGDPVSADDVRENVDIN